MKIDNGKGRSPVFETWGVKVLDGTPNYFAIEDIGRVSTSNDFKKLLEEMMNYVSNAGIQSVSIILGKEEASNPGYIRFLEEAHFKKHGIQYFFRRDLISLKSLDEPFAIKSIGETGKDLFVKVWEASTAESLNAVSLLSIEKQFKGMKSELGTDYRKSCLVAYKNENPIGVTMPHIEPGTIDEGRLFYFGLIPAFRGKGLATSFHRLSLQYLRKLGARHYIGATGHKNLPMQRVFQKNGCRPFETKVTYRLNRK